MEKLEVKEILTDELIDMGVTVRRFIDNLEDLRGFVHNLAPFTKAYDDKAKGVYEGVTSILRNVPKIPGQEKRIELDEEKVEGAAKGIVSLIKSQVATQYLNRNQTEILYKTSFVMLISYFDYLMSDIIWCYYKMFPGALSDKSGKELSISLDDLKRCDDKDEAVDYILSRKVDSVLYRNLNNQLNFFSSEFNIGLNKGIVKWNAINEAVERRNLVVHNSGIVNRRYINNVKRLAKGIKKDDVLDVDARYWKTIFEEVLLAGIVLAENCWRKWLRKETESAGDILVNEAGKAIYRENWNLLERLCLYAKGIPLSDGVDIDTIEIYYCHALKKLGKKDKMEAELKKFRRKELSPLIMAMVCALVDDKDGFYKCVEGLAELGKPSKESFIQGFDWPTLMDIRKDEDYEKRIERAYAKMKAVRND